MIVIAMMLKASLVKGRDRLALLKSAAEQSRSGVPAAFSLE